MPTILLPFAEGISATFTQDVEGYDTGRPAGACKTCGIDPAIACKAQIMGAAKASDISTDRYEVISVEQPMNFLKACANSKAFNGCGDSLNA